MELSSITFGILSDDDIVKLSACVIHKTTLTIENGSVYDPRMGCVQNGDSNGQLCITCGLDVWECTGHFGMIELKIPIILFHKQVVTLLKCICINCSRLLETGRKFKSFDLAIDYFDSVNTCANCNFSKPYIKFVIGDCSILMATDCTSNNRGKDRTFTELSPQFIKRVFDLVPDDDVRLLCLNPEMVHPRNYVLTKFLVVPTCCRPKILAGDNVSDDDLTLILVDILKANRYLETHEPKEDPVTFKKMVDSIKLKTLAYCDNSRGKATHNTNHKPYSGIKQRINCKQGLMRQNIIGKRADRTGRTVLGPDPTVKLDEVVIPHEIANILTIPEHVTPMNIEHLTKVVNSGKASTIVKSSGIKINVSHARTTRGTKLMHTDVIIRKNVGEIPVLDCRMKLLDTDFVKHCNGTTEAVRIPSSRHVELNVGDIVERYLKDGDPVFLNRQPTLHRNGILGMRAVVKPARTFRFNLATTKGFNADFDGDEGNIYCCASLAAHAELKHVVNVKDRMLSAQTNKPEQCMVQDSLLAAYLMTKKYHVMSRDDFQQCLFRTNKYHLFTPQQEYRTVDLFTYLLPKDFNAVYPKLTIRCGKIIDGYFDKTSLGSSSESIIRLLCIDYGKDVAADFIDNMQFIAHAWLELNPFSIGLDDCLPRNDDSLEKIIQNVEKYFMEADTIGKTVSEKTVKEAKINLALNNAKDIGLKIAIESLDEDNKMKDTVICGSKGDYFNIAQITGLLGQQNLFNQRPRPTLMNNRRTMIHYPEILNDSDRYFESRGFIKSSFLKGLNPIEMFFHAMTGREGMIKTASETAGSGYIQRSYTKLNEDNVPAYDGTVRDASNNIMMMAFGNTGFDPSLVTYRNGDALPVDFRRLCDRLNCTAIDSPLEKFSKDEIENIVKRCRWHRPPNIPKEISDSIWKNQETVLIRELEKLHLARDRHEEYARIVIEKYFTCLTTPGECVGIIGAQSIGEIQTQTNLNTFHTAGKLQCNGVTRFDEIMKMTKKLQNPMMYVYFKEKYASCSELRKSVASSIVGLSFEELINGIVEHVNEDVWTVNVKRKKLFASMISLDTVCDIIESETDYLACVEITGPLSLRITINKPVKSCIRKKKEIDTSTTVTKRKAIKFQQLLPIQLCGIKGITAMHIDRDDNGEFYIITEGSNLKKMLCHPMVDIKRLYTNDIWSYYDCLGIVATKRMLLNDMKRCISGVNECHPRLLVEKMTWLGIPSSITRYTMKKNAVGPLSRSTFEQCMDVLITAAHRCEIDKLNGVSSSVVTGKHIPIGTNYIDVLLDWKSITRRLPTE